MRNLKAQLFVARFRYSSAAHHAQIARERGDAATVAIFLACRDLALAYCQRLQAAIDAS